ncbi:MAG: hypothetical protein Tsb007_40360 [Rhizobacter sp.]
MTERSQDGLSTAELIRVELDGKNVALGRYDTILWQVRSGFVIVLYGALGLLFKDGLSLKGLSDQIVLLVCGFSVLAYAMDLVFRIRQLRVVNAYNRLVDQALKHSAGEQVDTATLRELLHLAGESQSPIGLGAALRAVLLIFAFYSFTPAAMLLLRLT